MNLFPELSEKIILTLSYWAAYFKYKKLYIWRTEFIWVALIGEDFKRWFQSRKKVNMKFEELMYCLSHIFWKTIVHKPNTNILNFISATLSRYFIECITHLIKHFPLIGLYLVIAFSYDTKPITINSIDKVHTQHPIAEQMLFIDSPFI